MKQAQFTGYKRTMCKGEQFAISAPGLAERWARADSEQRRKLVEAMKRQGGFDVITYMPAQSIHNLLLNNYATDEYGVTVGEF